MMRILYKAPKVSVKIDTDPKFFLHRLAEIILSTNDYKNVRFVFNDPILNNFPFLTWTFTGDCPHVHLIVTAIPDAKKTPRITFCISTTKWDPTYETYVQIARDIIAPLLKKYNSLYNSRRRLKVEPKNKTEPQMPQCSNFFFENFVKYANKRCLSADDWDRFYLFIRFAHTSNLQLIAEDIKRLLWLVGFSEEKAGSIADVYKHGRVMLKKRLSWLDYRNLNNYLKVKAQDPLQNILRFNST